MDPALSVTGLTKRYGPKVAVDDLSFEVGQGEIFGLLGPNGSGKTTTVECVQGLRRADTGRIDVFGYDAVRDSMRVRRLVGSQLQDSALPDRLRAGEALQLFSSFKRGGPPWEQLLDDWGLAAQRDTAFGDLSGGQRQRLFVALALVADPRLVVLDEMTTGLDPAARRVAWELVAALRDRGTTVLLVTHFMDEAERLCDRVGVLVDGHLVAHGTPAALVAAHQREQIVRFTGAPGVSLDFLHRVPGVMHARWDRGQVVVTGSGPLLARVGHALVSHGLEPEDLRADRASLEDAYLALSGTDPDVRSAG
jgi:ABC-2 type transport system ATP-binding protein